MCVCARVENYMRILCVYCMYIYINVYVRVWYIHTYYNSN